MTNRPLLVPLLVLGLAALPAAAGDDERDGKWCREHPAKCEELRARRAEFCKDNPETCARREQERAERKQWCAEHPERCDALKDERKERRAKIREKCEASPEECEKRREQFRERRKERSAAFCAENPGKCDGEPD